VIFLEDHPSGLQLRHLDLDVLDQPAIVCWAVPAYGVR
jgi:hypothetical protein